MNILFMGGHELGRVTLEYLIQKGKNIVGVVVTDTDDAWYRGVDSAATKYNIPLFREKNINTPEFVNKARELMPELIVVVNFDQILKKDIISLPPKGCINTHASLLPKYRGRAPLNWAMINGEKETGVTVHYINTGIDTGEIIIQEAIQIDEHDYIQDILDKVKSIYPIAVYSAVNQIEEASVTPIRQDQLEGFYCKKRSARDGQIDWGKSAHEIYNLIRAVSKPYPGAYTYYGKDKIIIWRAELSGQPCEQRNIQNGTVLNTENGCILVRCSGKNLLITEYEIGGNTEGDVKISSGACFNFEDDYDD